MAKSKDREFRGRIFSPLPRKVKIAKGLSGNDLCALCGSYFLHSQRTKRIL